MLRKFVHPSDTSSPLVELTIKDLISNELDCVVDYTEDGMTNIYRKLDRLKDVVCELSTMLTDGQQLMVAEALGYRPAKF